ncbi:MAG: sigma factor-like helix-turn-helix DNA-binding protein [Acidobacteriaceae bacterium]
MYYVEEMTLKEIGLVLGMVESRVSQIRTTAIEELRVRMEGELRWKESCSPTLCARGAQRMGHPEFR